MYTAYTAIYRCFMSTCTSSLLIVQSPVSSSREESLQQPLSSAVAASPAGDISGPNSRDSGHSPQTCAFQWAAAGRARLLSFSVTASIAGRKWPGHGCQLSSDLTGRTVIAVAFGLFGDLMRLPQGARAVCSGMVIGQCMVTSRARRTGLKFKESVSTAFAGW